MVREGGDTPSFSPLEDVSRLPSAAARAKRAFERASAANCIALRKLPLTAPSSAPQTWGMYLLAAFIVIMLFYPLYLQWKDPTIYGQKVRLALCLTGAAHLPPAAAAAAARLLQLLLRLRLRLLLLREHRRFLALLLLLLLLLLAASADQAPRVCAPSQKKKSKMSAESVRKAQGKKA